MMANRGVRLGPLRIGRLLLAAVALSAGCRGDPDVVPPITEWSAGGSRSVAAFLPAAGDTAVLLVYAPSQCFTCDGELSKWMSVSRDRGWRVHLFLTAEPSPGERDQLRLFRLEPAGVLQGPITDLETPRVYRFAGKTLVDTAVGTPAQNGLLNSLLTQGTDSVGAIP
jgi:hypothetical protein